jgi:hypothetical protein
VEAHEIAYPVYVAGDAFVDALGVSAYPTNYYISAAGTVRATTVGASSGWGMRWRLHRAAWRFQGSSAWRRQRGGGCDEKQVRELTRSISEDPPIASFRVPVRPYNDARRGAGGEDHHVPKG